MIEYRLKSKAETALSLGKYFLGEPTGPLVLSVREDKCFKPAAWLAFGTIRLEAGEPERGEETLDRLLAAVKFGFFEWVCPTEQTLTDGIIAGLEITQEGQKKKIHRVLDAFANVAARVGLIHPLFDADSIAQMPFRRPTTVVPDTSAILQGGLDFVVRFLYPVARLKVPAIAHMEILNSADNYFKYRRADKVTNKLMMLSEHAKSQGGQRALLRLELQTDAEIERGRLGSDPLRGVIHPDSDPEDRSLGLERVQRSFVDRLIFETARQHLSQASPDHPVTLMTSDQGLARMTLGEGLQPLFFEAVTYAQISGRTLSGTTFNPFTGQMYWVGLTDLLWELAVTFGTARIATEDGSRFVEACAIDERLSWKPYHAKDDLLWVRIQSKAPAVTMSGLVAEEPAPNVEPEVAKEPKVSAKQAKAAVPVKKPKEYSGSYKFSVGKMLKLMEALSATGSLSPEAALPVLNVNSTSQLEDYRNFLLAGRLIEGSAPMVATNDLQNLIKFLKGGDLAGATTIVRQVPSFAEFYRFLSSERPDNPIAERAQKTYVALSEILGIGMEIPEDRIYGTLSEPSAKDFAEKALSAYQSLGGGPDKYVLTGQWLEELVRNHGIHPVTSRALLESARKQGLIERFTEGSTPETSYRNHTLDTLDRASGSLAVRRFGLFEGDFLLPGKSSVSIRLKRGQL